MIRAVLSESVSPTDRDLLDWYFERLNRTGGAIQQLAGPENPTWYFANSLFELKGHPEATWLSWLGKDWGGNSWRDRGRRFFLFRQPNFQILVHSLYHQKILHVLLGSTSPVTYIPFSLPVSGPAPVPDAILLLHIEEISQEGQPFVLALLHGLYHRFPRHRVLVSVVDPFHDSFRKGIQALSLTDRIEVILEAEILSLRGVQLYLECPADGDHALRRLWALEQGAMVAYIDFMAGESFEKVPILSFLKVDETLAELEKILGR